ncbi:uncharacterized protein LOC100903740 [Galendromus occidentalis]|uniref:Uncharacterized protein LOC100903740 n=1 Tax=Galendromus occidentalis TaxID=34638 RepID=A0AAJ6VXG2_9ACAR|nr:uncharacterized protein LOC100903740 [Galendromus occidentalis]
MTLNPSAQVFIPSSQTLKLLEETASPAVDSEKCSASKEFSPPQLESLYIDFSEMEDDGELPSSRLQSVSGTIDYTNFDLPFFFHDMMSADSEDFSNYLSDRAEYLLGYAGTSQIHALEIVDTILDTVFNLLRKNGREFKRPLKLAAEMCDMDRTFLQMMLQQMLRLLDYLSNPLMRDLAYSVLFGLMLSELHVGTCVAPPETPMGFAEEVRDLFLALLQDKKSVSAAVFAIEQSETQLKSIWNAQQIECICSILRRISARFASTELHYKCLALQKKLRQQTSYLCLKAHAMPVAQLNEEEARDFEAFLLESRRDFYSCRD